MPQSTKRAQCQVVEEPFLGVLQELQTNRDPRLGITLKIAKLNDWTLQALASALGVSRERIRQRIAKAAYNPHMVLPDVPMAPRRSEPEEKPIKPTLRIKPEIADHLYAMWEIASKVNGGTAADAPERQVSVEYTSLLASLVDQGVTIGEIARTLGVAQSGVKARLARHGYRKASPSQARHAYKGIPAKEKQDECKWGHPLSGDNLYVAPKSGNRGCKECVRRNADAYRARKRAAEGLGAPRPYRRKTP